MSFRRKLLLVFALTVFVSVAAVTWVISVITRRAFERVNGDRTVALISQFRREFDRRGDEVARKVAAIAASDATTRMALAVSHGTPDYAAYLNEAKNIADNQQLDFLEFVDAQGVIISSAQWPAKFGYRETSPPDLSRRISQSAFLRQEDLPEGAALGLSAVAAASVGDKPLYVIGGRKLDRDFLASLELPAGMRAMLYQNLRPDFSSQFLIDPSGTVQASALAPLIQMVRPGQEATETIHWTADAADGETIHAIPLTGESNQLLGVLLVGSSQRPYVELRRRIRSSALLVGSVGIVVAILLSGWAAARVTRPVEQLAEAAREVAAGNWSTQVEVHSRDEIGDLAESFNRMTREMLEQRERLVQSERVAAWRELARRLAHELKNPLFPLQLTVETMLRAQQQSPEQFDEIFRESSSTLLAELANLKAIVSRFSEFSKMPLPQLRSVQVNEVAAAVARLFQAQFESRGTARIECRLELEPSLPPIAADGELLHRALSNLVLNAMDAMPNGGTLSLRTRHEGGPVRIEVSDTGIGLTPEECSRLFTPYYTSKQHGTGLGLAIVQSVVSDHGGKISVQSQPGQGTTLVMELPVHIEKLNPAAESSAALS
jgi:two-component system, NtrC family, nitrogen regulation sensor histidine kinase NtrY